MILQVSVLVDIDTTDTDIEDLRGEITAEARNQILKFPEDVMISPLELGMDSGELAEQKRQFEKFTPPEEE